MKFLLLAKFLFSSVQRIIAQGKHPRSPSIDLDWSVVAQSFNNFEV
jgi:hypothetical protein